MALICRSGFDIGGLLLNIGSLLNIGGLSLAGASGELQQTFGQDIVGRQSEGLAVVLEGLLPSEVF